jgi:8-oxo-dGTP pyrophosphatase MutT (NUDIX family)
MADAAEEPLNVYDSEGNVIGTQPRAQAKQSGLAVGAVNVLLVNTSDEVLLQRRPPDKENGGLWDKSVGGHVGAGETFDATAVREAGEELFDDGTSPRVVLAADEEDFLRRLGALDLRESIVFRRVSLQKNLRDVRHAPGGGLRNVLYHVAIYLGRTDVPLEGFRPQGSEIAELRYAPASEVDTHLLRGELSPNMAFLWLVHGHRLLREGRR